MSEQSQNYAGRLVYVSQNGEIGQGTYYALYGSKPEQQENICIIFPDADSQPPAQYAPATIINYGAIALPHYRINQVSEVGTALLEITPFPDEQTEPILLPAAELPTTLPIPAASAQLPTASTFRQNNMKIGRMVNYSRTRNKLASQQRSTVNRTRKALADICHWAQRANYRFSVSDNPSCDPFTDSWSLVIKIRRKGGKGKLVLPVSIRQKSFLTYLYCRQPADVSIVALPEALAIKWVPLR